MAGMFCPKLEVIEDFPGCSAVKNPPAKQETQVRSLCQEDSLEKEMATHSNILSWDFPGKNTGVGCHFLLQGIFPTQGLNLSLLLGRRILYHEQPGKPLNNIIFSKLDVTWRKGRH